MFVTIVLNTEYMDYSSRIKWYLKNLYHAKENGWLVITHEFLFRNHEKLQETVDDRFFNEFEMQPLSKDDFDSIDQYVIPDELFNKKEKDCGSRTEMLFDLANNRFPEFENHIYKAIDQIQRKHPSEVIEGVFHCLEGYESLHFVFNEHNIPLISYVFSAIRKVHGYMQTLYIANTKDNLVNSVECEKRYNKFINEDSCIPILENREIIALFGKERTLPLIKLIDYEPQYEMCVCGSGFLLVPSTFSKANYTDEDIYYECNRLFPHNQMRYRQHRMQLEQLQIDYSEVRSDPASLILSCKRTTAVSSQIVLKAMLWNRTAVMKKDTLPFSFMCEKNYDSERKVDLKFLNYYLFCYLVPSELMFSQEYWRWRLTFPTEIEIYNKHLNFYFGQLNISASVLSEENKNTRFRLLLEARNCDKDLIDSLLSKKLITEVDYDTATSKLVVSYIEGREPKVRSYWRLNEFRNGTIISKFIVKVGGKVNRIAFYPLDDKAGMVEVEKISIYSIKKQIKTISCKRGFSLFEKSTGNFEVNLPENITNEFEVECKWKYKAIKNNLIDNRL
jgi:hypothetical protein